MKRVGPRPISLGMYDLAEIRDDVMRLANEIAAGMNAVTGCTAIPPGTSPSPNELWQHPRLLLAQTCGYPLVTTLRGRVRPVATPCYRADGCAGPYYRSWIVARADDPREAIEDFSTASVAVNDPDSLSGRWVWKLVGSGAAVERRFARVVYTGGHVHSVEAVARGVADIAAIDCVTWHLLRLHRKRATATLHVIAAGPRLPALPLITSTATSDEELAALRASVFASARDPKLESTRRRLLLGDYRILDFSDYLDALAPLLLDDPGP